MFEHTSGSYSHQEFELIEDYAKQSKILNKYKVAYNTAMKTLEQIASSPRNTQAKLNASATLGFLRTQFTQFKQGD
jgi:hypothetical protein